MADDTEIERLERCARNDNIARLKIQRDNALIDMDRFWKERDELVLALENARRDILALQPRSDTGSRRARQISDAVARIEYALASVSTGKEP